jgi:hypothetical protein
MLNISELGLVQDEDSSLVITISCPTGFSKNQGPE